VTVDVDVANQLTSTRCNASEEFIPDTACFSYHQYLDKCKTLYNIVQHSTTDKQNLELTLDLIIDRYRKGMEVVVPLDANICIPISKDDTSEKAPLRATLRAVPNATSIGRLKPNSEKRWNTKKRKRGVTPSSHQNMSQDQKYAKPGRERVRNCKVCKEPGHTTINCQHLTRYGTPLARFNGNVRSELAESLNDSSLVSLNIEENDQRMLYDAIPHKGIIAMIVHRRFVNGISLNNVFIEITLLICKNGHIVEHIDYTKALVKKQAVYQRPLID